MFDQEDDIDNFISAAFDGEDTGDMSAAEARVIREAHFRKLRVERDTKENKERENYQENFSKIEDVVRDAETKAKGSLTLNEIDAASVRRGQLAASFDNIEEKDISEFNMEGLDTFNGLDKSIEEKLSAGYHAYRDAGPSVEGFANNYFDKSGTDQPDEDDDDDDNPNSYWNSMKHTR
jgi:hypothetical protein